SPPVPKAPEGFPLLSAAVCAPKKPRSLPARPAVRQNAPDATPQTAVITNRLNTAKSTLTF
ncbi:MAG: hypothetical protein K2L46_02240, partial [Paramuribaculum sp.]|nr:hypothetical protein [Paramuribaculum sp.]